MSDVLIGFVGDVHVDRPDPTEAFSEVRKILSVPDILFANLEGTCTDDPRPVPSAGEVFCSAAHNLEVFGDVGFNVLSLANNHIMDAGYEALLDNKSRLAAQGVQTCGAGSNLSEARAAAVLDAKGLKIAFLGYTSTFPFGCEARDKSPGVAPMRAYNFWREPFPAIHAPGMRPYVTTIPDQGDLDRLTQDIRQAAMSADLVIVSFHWGDPTHQYHLTDHELRTARHCVDNGASMVVGHHHHSLRGMEWYKGKPIMYGLGQFVFDWRWEWEGEPSAKPETDMEKYFKQIEFAWGPRKGWPLLPMSEDTRMTMLAWATANKSGISDIGFLPCRIAPDGRVHPVAKNTPEWSEVVDYLNRCNKTQGLKSDIVSNDAMRIAGFNTLRVVPAKA